MKYFIVWNADKTEGFISLGKGAQDTAMTNKADRSRGYPSRSTVAAAFFEAYRGERKTRDAVEIPADAVNSHASPIEGGDRLRAALEQARAALNGEPEYHHQGMGCGLEDRNITDRYDAMEHGWECAIERVCAEHINPAVEIIDAALSHGDKT